MTRLIVLTGFIVAFCAGLMVGTVWHGPLTPGNIDRPRDRESWIAQQLELTPDQQKQMKEIWSEVGRGGGRDQFAKRAEIRRDQEIAIAGLINNTEYPAYQQIIEDHKKRLDALEAENKRIYQQAVDKTKTILAPEQLTKYEALLARPEGRGGPSGGRGRGFDGRSSDGPGHGPPPEK